MLKQLLAEVPAGFICFILYVVTLKGMMGMWIMQMVTGS